MTSREKINYLSQYTGLLKERDELVWCYNYLKNKLYTTPTAVLSDMPHAQRIVGDKTGNGLAQLEQLETTMQTNIDGLTATHEKIERLIRGLDNLVYRRLMILRYMRGLCFEEIAVEMSYCWRQIHRMHCDALDLIDL